MGQRIILAACGFLILARTDRHLALAAGNDAGVGHALEGAEFGFHLLFPVFFGIAGKEA